MFHGGSQRLQVYTLLMKPTEGKLDDFTTSAECSGVFSMEVSFEKLVRSVDLPEVLFPKVPYRSIELHAKYVLPALYKKSKILVYDARRSCLVVHTEAWAQFDTRQVTSPMRTFLSTLD